MSAALGEIEAFLSGETVRADAPDEAAWHAHWDGTGLGALPPAGMAVRGGLMARSLPQVFIAGYQAALRTVFPALPGDGWGAFVAAEDRTDPESYPGTVLTGTADDLRLSGFKSWVGQSRHVRHLMVSAKQDGENRLVSVGRDAPGLTLTHRDKPSFLAGLSQGFARFEDTPVTMINGVEGRTFARAEPLFIMLAGAAFLLAEAEGENRDRAATLTVALADYATDGTFRPKLLATLDRELQVLARSHSGDGVPDWQADRRLFGMFSPRIQKRA